LAGEQYRPAGCLPAMAEPADDPTSTPAAVAAAASPSTANLQQQQQQQQQHEEAVRPIVQRTRFQGVLAVLAIATAGRADLSFGDAVPVAESLLALGGAVVVVSGATDAVERITASPKFGNWGGGGGVPPYDPSGSRFDQATWAGRYCSMLLACDPRLLLYSRAEVGRYRTLAYDGWRQRRIPPTKAPEAPDDATDSGRGTSSEIDRRLWEAKRIADSALHPTTGEWIPRPFRMAGYLPANGPICVAMIASKATLPLLFWSWMNQSQNAMVNYFNGPRQKEDASNNNGSAGNGTSLAPLVQSYGLAVASALSVAWGLATYVEAHCAADEAARLLRFVSFPSAVVASSLNCYIVRRPEIAEGVPLLAPRSRGAAAGDACTSWEDVLPGQTSQIAAARGVYATTASRAVLQMPTYLIPPLILDAVAPLKEYLAEHPALVVPVTTFLLLVSFGIGLPLAVGIFPQLSRVGVDDVEDKFRGLGYDEFYYNKGL